MPTFLNKIIHAFAPDLKKYSRKAFQKDLGAGITVGIVALPLSLALAIATGVPPILGLYTAAIAGFIASLTAGSAYSVSGPAAAMVPILAAIIAKHGMEQLPYITILAALFLISFAILGIGTFISKVPESVVLGFTGGVAIVIFCGQLNNFFGLTNLGHHESFTAKFVDTLSHFGTVHAATLGIGLLALAIIIVAPMLKWLRGIPPTLIAIIVTILLVTCVPALHGVGTLGSAYGNLPQGFPAFNDFAFTPSHLTDSGLLLPAFEIAALVAIESLLCAVVADKLTRTKHRPNQELFAQGLGNLGSAFFGGIPSTGVIARTGTIIKNHAHSRVASIIHALMVMLFIVALAPLAAKIPLAALSAVLMFTAYKIAEIKEIIHFVRSKSWKLSAVLGVTLALTTLRDLVTGVACGLLLHLLFKAHGMLRSAREQDGPITLREQEI